MGCLDAQGDHNRCSSLAKFRSTTIHETYKIISIWSIVRPFVSGSRQYDQMVATIKNPAKKNQVPYPKESNMYGRHLLIGNCVAHWTRAAQVPEKFRRAPGKISAETIQGTPFRPNDQKMAYIMIIPVAAWPPREVDSDKVPPVSTTAAGLPILT